MTVKISYSQGPISGLAELFYPIWKRIRPSSKLEVLLRDYPPYLIPNPGNAYHLKKEQRQENLDYFLGQKFVRIDHISRLLTQFGINARPALDPNADLMKLFTPLQAWALKEWPNIRGIEAISDSRYADNSRYDQSDIALSMLYDLSILLGESVVRRRPDFAWALDADRGSRQRQTTTWGRIVLIRARNPEMGWLSKTVDITAGTIYSCNEMARNRFFRQAVLTRVYDPALWAIDEVPVVVTNK